MSTPQQKKIENAWIRLMTFLKWYPSSMPSSEKLLVLKLDLSILIFGCLSFFTKYLDQQSLTNAYVSGMKESLGLHGNSLNYITATFRASYCTAMIPACYMLIKYRANIILPTLELGWGLATFGLAWAQNVQTIYAMRFFVGLFECCSFTGTIYIMGSWYKPSEIGRRIALFYISSPGGTMFAGYLQAVAYKNLNGVHGLEGWRWLFVIDAVITLSIAFFGNAILPDVPSRAKPLALTPHEHINIFARVLGRWHFYAFVTLWTMLDLNIQPSGQAFSLYLKAFPERYSVVQVNTLPTVVSAINIVSALSAGIVADRLNGRFWIPALVTSVPVLVGIVLLNIWDVGFAGRLAGFMLGGFMAPISPMTMGWATTITSYDAEERAVVTASMNAIGQGIAAGAQVAQFPAAGAPRWVMGFRACLGTTIAQFVVILGILGLSVREKKNNKRGKGGKGGAGSV